MNFLLSIRVSIILEASTGPIKWATIIVLNIWAFLKFDREMTKK